MSASDSVSSVTTNLPPCSAWTSAPGIRDSALRKPGTSLLRTWRTRLEMCASDGTGSAIRPVRTSRRDTGAEAVIGPSHRPGGAGEHVVHPDQEPPAGDHPHRDEGPDDDREQNEQEPLAPPERICRTACVHEASQMQVRGNWWISNLIPIQTA